MAKPGILSIIGAGGMGLAVARRLGTGRRIVLADFSKDSLSAAANTLAEAGHDVSTHEVDVADPKSVSDYASRCRSAAEDAGGVEAVVHTAGLSPAMASAKRIFEVDLLGTANVIEAFNSALFPGTSMVCISSMARYMASPGGALMPPDLALHLRGAPAAELLGHPGIDTDQTHPALAYAISKQANFLRVQGAATAFGSRGARINSISPGVIMTDMVRQELESPGGSSIRKLIEMNPLRRGGRADEIANVVAFLTSPDASYVNGTDILVDGGQIAAGNGMLGSEKDTEKMAKNS